MNEAHTEGDRRGQAVRPEHAGRPAHAGEAELDSDDLPPIEDDPELDGPPARGPDSFDAGTYWEPQDASTDSEGDHGDAELDPRTAAGVVLVRTTETGPRVAVLESGGVISLPKAEVAPGGSAETAANRAAEVFTGLRVRLTDSLGETEDWLEGERVAAWFWLARPTRGNALDAQTPPPAGFTLHWIDLEEACQALTSDAEASIVDRVRAMGFSVRKRPFASPATIGLARDLEAFRDDSVATARGVTDPDALDALLRARDEIERAEDRLARGDAAGARRARARAERETLSSLDAEGRAIAFRRVLDRAPEHMRMSLGATAPPPGTPVSLDVLTAVHAAVEAALEEDEREREIRRASQAHATLALTVTTLAVIAAAVLGLFQTAPRPVLDTWMAALIFSAAGLLGGWVGEGLYALREANRSRHIALPMAAAAGALAGLAVGAFLSNGLSTFIVENAALTIAATFAAGWVVRTVLPRGS